MLEDLVKEIERDQQADGGGKDGGFGAESTAGDELRAIDRSGHETVAGITA